MKRDHEDDPSQPTAHRRFLFLTQRHKLFASQSGVANLMTHTGVSSTGGLFVFSNTFRLFKLFFLFHYRPITATTMAMVMAIENIVWNKKYIQMQNLI